MLAFYIYTMPAAAYLALAERLAEGSLNPLQHQNLLAQDLAVSGYDAETAAYLTRLEASGWTVPAVRLNAYTRCLGVQSGLLEAVLHERTAFVEAHLLPDIRKVNKNLLAAAGRPSEWTVVLVEEN